MTTLIAPRRLLLLGALLASCLFGGAHPAAADDGLATALKAVTVVHTADGTGTAFVVAPDTLLTAEHVVGTASVVQLQPASGPVRPASVVRKDAATDLAVLHADTAGLPALMIRKSPAAVGEDVYAAGAALGSPSVSRGVISGHRVVHGISELQTDAAVNPGNSGGPLLDDHEHVLGLVVAKLTDAEGVGLAVPADRLQALLDGTPAGSSAPAGQGPDVVLPVPAADRGTPLTAVVTLVAVIAGGVLLLGLSLRHRARQRRTAPVAVAPLPRPVPIPPSDDDLVIILHSTPDRSSQEN